VPFAVTLTFGQDPHAAIQRLRHAHVEYIRGTIDQILAGSSVRGDDGTLDDDIIILRTNDRSAAEAWVAILASAPAQQLPRYRPARSKPPSSPAASRSPPSTTSTWTRPTKAPQPPSTFHSRILSRLPRQPRPSAHRHDAAIWADLSRMILETAAAAVAPLPSPRRAPSELAINEGTLGNWINAYRRDHVGEEPPLTRRSKGSPCHGCTGSITTHLA
jgi:hypothetical protein